MKKIYGLSIFLLSLPYCTNAMFSKARTPLTGHRARISNPQPHVPTRSYLKIIPASNISPDNFQHRDDFYKEQMRDQLKEIEELTSLLNIKINNVNTTYENYIIHRRIMFLIDEGTVKKEQYPCRADKEYLDERRKATYKKAIAEHNLKFPDHKIALPEE